LLAPIRGKAKPRPASKDEINRDIMPLILLGDPHLGMHSWGRQTGVNFDLDIAEHITGRAVEKLVSRTLPCEVATLISVGDTLHTDGNKPTTPTGGNILDVDSRFPKMLDIAIRTFKWCIEAMLRMHNHVHVIIVPGNHDPTVSYC